MQCVELLILLKVSTLIIVILQAMNALETQSSRELMRSSKEAGDGVRQRRDKEPCHVSLIIQIIFKSCIDRGHFVNFVSRKVQFVANKMEPSNFVNPVLPCKSILLLGVSLMKTG